MDGNSFFSGQSGKIKLFVATVICVFIILFFLFPTKRIQGGVQSIILFYRPGCPWCDMFEPEWIVIEEKFGRHRTKKINTSLPQSAELTKTHNVSGVPTVIFIDATGAGHQYKGAKTAEAILAISKA